MGRNLLAMLGLGAALLFSGCKDMPQEYTHAVKVYVDANRNGKYDHEMSGIFFMRGEYSQECSSAVVAFKEKTREEIERDLAREKYDRTNNIAV